MERFLISLDCSPGSLKCIQYVSRVLNGAGYVHLTLFHVLPTTSPNLLSKEDIKRIEHFQEGHPHLSGYFWDREHEEQMNRTFEEARQVLLQGGFGDNQIKTCFSVESVDIAQVIIKNATDIGCSTIVMGRRKIGRVRGFLLGSVSKDVLKQAKEITVWVVDS